MPALVTIPHTPKRKPQPAGGKHKTERSPIQVPKAWLKLIRERASQCRQPHTWYVLGLIAEDMKANGVGPLPALPWEPGGEDLDDDAE